MVKEITTQKNEAVRKDPELIRTALMKKEATLNLLMQHPRGLDKIAAVLTNPVRKHLDYVSISRKVVVVEPIPEGQIAYYDADIEEFSGVKVAEDGSSRFIVTKAVRTQLEPYEIFAKAKVPFKELRIRKYKVFDRMKERIKQAMQIKEDLIWFGLFHTASTLSNTETQETDGLTKDGFANAFYEIEKHRLITQSVIMNPAAVRSIRKWQRDYVDEVARIEIRRTGYIGNLFGASFYVTNLIDVGAASTYYTYAYALAPQEFVAWYPIYADAEVVPADRGDDGLLGLTCYQLCGSIVHNSFGVSRIRFNGTK
jgi:hypothetical protein